MKAAIIVQIAFLCVLHVRVKAWQPPGSITDGLSAVLPEVSNLPGFPMAWQAQTELLWQQHKHKVSYCVGNKVSYRVCQLVVFTENHLLLVVPRMCLAVVLQMRSSQSPSAQIRPA